MAKWYEVTWFKSDKFRIEVIFKSGKVLKFPKGFFKEFTVKKNNITGKVDSLSWVESNQGNLLRIDIEDISAIVTYR